jgi:hypothetical protein
LRFGQVGLLSGGLGDIWRKIAISLIDADFGEQTAQTGENA